MRRVAPELLDMVRPHMAAELPQFETEDLAAILLELLNKYDGAHNTQEPCDYFQSGNFLTTCVGVQNSHKPEIKRALVEAWAWLASERFIAHDGNLWFVTRR